MFLNFLLNPRVIMLFASLALASGLFGVHSCKKRQKKLLEVKKIEEESKVIRKANNEVNKKQKEVDNEVFKKFKSQNKRPLLLEKDADGSLDKGQRDEVREKSFKSFEGLVK